MNNSKCIKNMNDQTPKDELELKKTVLNKLQESNIKLSDQLIDFIAGSTAGAAQVLVAQPFDTVKVKQQTFPRLYKNMIDCFLKTYTHEGLFRGLYAGTMPALIASVSENSVLFTAYGSCRRFVAVLCGLSDVKDLPILGEAFAGSFASFFSTFVLCPTELVKCKLQAINEVNLLSKAERNRPMPQMTMGKLIRNIYKSDGIPGFYRGLTSTFVREMPGYFCFFGCYEGTREFFREPEKTRDDVGPLVTISAGALAGIMLWTVTFPADVIKSRIQINDMTSSMWKVGIDIARTEGFLALYNGLLPSIIRTIPATAALFLVYEFVKKSLNQRNIIQGNMRS